MISFGLNSCKQTDQGHPQYSMDGFLLNANQKALFNYFNPGFNMQFFDSIHQNILQIQEVSVLDNDSADFHLAPDLGEVYQDYYNEISNNSPNIKFYCKLIGVPNNGCALGIEFYPQNNNSYMRSPFVFNPYDSNKSDTIYSDSSLLNMNNSFVGLYNYGFSGKYYYKLLDSVTFSSHTFYDVYYLKTTTDDTLVNYCYYSIPKGIVGFQIHSDSTFWIRGN